MNKWIADLSLWHFPASLILGTAFVLGLWVLDRYYRNSKVYTLLTSLPAAVVLTILVVLLLIAEGIWAIGLYRTWPFIATVLLLAASLGLVTLKRLRTRRNAGFLLHHGGMFILLWGGLFGAPDTTEARMIVRTGETQSLAYTVSGNTIPLPFGTRLDHFDIDFYDDGITPRQFRSTLDIDAHTVEVSVNNPIRHAGYTLYQDGYDTQHGAYTVLLVVRDPWLWVVWLGIAMLAAGSILLIFDKR